jgi:hypothetical protein
VKRDLVHRLRFLVLIGLFVLTVVAWTVGVGVSAAQMMGFTITAGVFILEFVKPRRQR